MDSAFLPPWVIQVFGLAIIAVFIVVKIESGQESALLVGVGVTFVIGGTAQGAWNKFKRDLYKGNQPEEQAKVDE